jgi:hypothetical protein
MAMLAELVIKLSADSAALRQDFQRVTNMAEKLGRQIKSAFSTLGVTIGIAGIAAAIKSAAAYGEQIEMAA